MGVYDKLEAIRKKPEHIRIRYVWASVAVSMVFVVAIWIFSMKSNRGESQSSINDLKNSELFEEFSDQKEELEGATEGFQKALNNQPMVENQTR